ncbi:MAG: 5'-methylthioadenosine/adenosylhomocysteine nucleosidase [Prevotella sp.]|nr:5'-methylthioadenosine/adenosylhomocysteine nucleosidase [Prevotella sp.]
MTIGVISAMTKEHEQLTGLLTDACTEHEGAFHFTIGTVGANTLILMQCGIGKVNAAVGTTTLIRRYTPDCVISTGCAGGIDESLNIMDVVVSTQTAYHDVVIPGCEHGQVQGLPTYFRAEEQLVETALTLNHLAADEQDDAPQHRSVIRSGLICSGDQFISDRAELTRIKQLFPSALAVDMESAAIAQTCFLLQTPFVSFRILSDTPGADQHLEQYFNLWDEMASRSFEVTRRFLTALPVQFSVLQFEG